MSRPHVPAVARHLLLVLAAVPALALAQSSPAISTIVAFSNSAVNAGPVRGPDGALYGTTSTVTAVTGGLIYRAAADGSSVRTLYQLKLTDGLNPLGGLLLGSDGLLYGTTSSGTAAESATTGTVFRIAPDGSGFTILHRFQRYTGVNSVGSPINTDGANPETELVEGVDGALYGVARSGGPNGTGVVFRMSRDGTQFAVLLAFDGVFRPVTFDDPGITYVLTGFDGAEDSTLVADPAPGVAGNRVARVVKSATAAATAGTTVSTGANASVDAVPFSATGTRVTVRVYPSKAGVPVRLRFQDAADPTRSVETEATTTKVNEWETLTFDFAEPAPGTPALNLAHTYNKLTIHFDYGRSGAAGGNGTYYFEEVRFSGCSSSVSSANRYGLNPVGPLVIAADGFLYGTTSGGGACGNGTVFRLGLDGTDLKTLHVFSALAESTTSPSTNADGARPIAGVTDGQDGRLYGVASLGGTLGYGTVFALDPVGGVFTPLHQFNGNLGSGPTGELLLAQNGSLIGTTTAGGTNASGNLVNAGTIFSIARDGTGFTSLHSFDRSKGAVPTGQLLQLGPSTIVGVTTSGGRCNQGTLYNFSLTGATVDGNTSCGQKKNKGGGSTGPMILLLLGTLGLLRRLRSS